MKYAATIALGAWLAVALWVGALLAKPAADARPALAAAIESPTAALQTELLRTQQARLALTELQPPQASGPRSQEAVIAALVAPALTSLASGTNAGAGSDGAPAATAERQLSFVYFSRDFRRAVIDGVYVQPGSRLPDGARVLDIGTDSVALRDSTGRRVLKVRQLLAEPADGRPAPTLRQ